MFDFFLLILPQILTSLQPYSRQASFLSSQFYEFIGLLNFPLITLKLYYCKI